MAKKKQKIMVAKTPKEPLDTPAQIISALEALKQDAGWHYIVKVLEDNIKVVEHKLFGNMDWDKDDTLESLQNQRNDREELKSLPDTLIKEIKGVRTEEINFDPYD